MARPRKNGICKRVQLRIPEDLESVFDNYSSDQLSEVMAIALRTISPDSPLGLSLPTLVRPIEPITKTVVRLQIQSRCIRLVFPEKRDDFRGVVVSLGYEWSQWCWQKNISQTADLCDRAAEVTHLLLLKGFCVQVEHTEIRDRAIAASYEPEHFRLIDASTSQPYVGWFVFHYPRSEDWYASIMRITAAKYADGKIRVPPEYFAEVEDFAEQKGFHFLPAASEILENARVMWEAAMIVRPHQPQKPSNPLDNAEVVIPESLKDED